MKKEEIKKKIKDLLDVPQKANIGDENKDIEKKLGFFLVDIGYIKDIKKTNEGWGFVYQSSNRKIIVSKREMPHTKWEQCIFKMGINKETGENLFPTPRKETEKYRFLHEANHAYQEYLCFVENRNNPKEWYQKSLEGEIKSCYGKLFNFCFQKRAQEDENEGEKKMCEKGLSVWGNAPNYNYKNDSSIPNKASEIAVRAQEDANELITMFLWHPDYFNTYLDYLSLNHNNREVREKEITQEDLNKRGLVRISNEEKIKIKKMVFSYVEEMKKKINY